MVRVVAAAAGKEFGAQPRVFVNLEHIDAHVRNAGRDGFVDGELPAPSRLMWQPGDEVDVDV